MIISGQILEFEVSIELYYGLLFKAGIINDSINTLFLLGTEIYILPKIYHQSLEFEVSIELYLGLVSSGWSSSSHSIQILDYSTTSTLYFPNILHKPLTVITQLSDSYQTVIRQLSDSYQTVIRQLSDSY